MSPTSSASFGTPKRKKKKPETWRGLTPQPRPAPTTPAAPEKKGTQNITPLAGGKVRIQTGKTTQVLSAQQWKALGEAKKYGGRGIRDPGVRAAYLQREKVIEAQRLAGPAFEAEQMKLKMGEEAQARKLEDIKSYVTPSLTEPFPTPEGAPLPELGGTSAPIESLMTEEQRRAFHKRAGGIVGSIRNIEIIGKVADVGIKAVNHNDWYDLSNSKQRGRAAIGEFDQIETDVMEGNEDIVGAQIRWTRAENMLNAAAAVAHQISTENPIYFGKEGMELQFEYEEVRLTLNNRARGINRVLSFPGEGRRATTRETGLSGEEPLE